MRSPIVTLTASMPRYWAVTISPRRLFSNRRAVSQSSEWELWHQLRELRQFVANQTAEGWHLVGEYIHQASGKSANRPELQRLFRDAAERRFDLLLFWALDRFSREGVVDPPAS